VTVVSSHLGYDQWTAALQQPPHLTTMIVLVTPPILLWNRLRGCNRRRT